MAWKKTDYARFAKGPIYGGITGGYESKTMAFPEEEYDTGGYIKSSLAREEAPFMYAPQGPSPPGPTYATNLPGAATKAQGRGENVMFLSDRPETEQFLAEREGAGAPPFKQVIPSVNMQKAVAPPPKPTKTGLKAFDLTQEAIENFVNPQTGIDGRSYNPVEEGIKARNEYFKLAYKGLMPSEIDALTSDQIKKVESDADKYLKLEQEKATIKLGQWKDLVKAVETDIKKMVEEEDTKVPKGEEELIRDALQQRLGRPPTSQEILDAMQARTLEKAQAALDVNAKSIDIDALAESVAQGQDSPSSIKGSMGNPVGSKVKSVILQKYPKFSSTLSDANYKWKQSSINMRTINFAGGALPRVSMLADQLSNLPSTSIPAINKIIRQVAIQTGQPEYADFESNRNAIVQEINSALSGSSTPSDMRIRIELENLVATRSPAQIKAAIINLREALISRVDVDLSPLYPIEVVRGERTMEDYKKELYSKYRGNYKTNADIMNGKIKLPPEIKTTSQAIDWLINNQKMDKNQAVEWLRAQ